MSLVGCTPLSPSAPICSVSTFSSPWWRGLVLRGRRSLHATLLLSQGVQGTLFFFASLRATDVRMPIPGICAAAAHAVLQWCAYCARRAAGSSLKPLSKETSFCGASRSADGIPSRRNLLRMMCCASTRHPRSPNPGSGRLTGPQHLSQPFLPSCHTDELWRPQIVKTVVASTQCSCNLWDVNFNGFARCTAQITFGSSFQPSQCTLAVQRFAFTVHVCTLT